MILTKPRHSPQSVFPLAVLIVIAALALIVPSSSNAVVLGSANFLSNGGGWGEEQPAGISNGGVPSGNVSNITWKNWGQPTTTAIGTGAIYKPAGQYYPPVRVRLKAAQIGTCPGEATPAYLQLYFRFPSWPGSPLGPWTKWSGVDSLCDYSRTHYSPEPGDCGYTGEYGNNGGDVKQIIAYKVSCRVARRIAKSSNSAVPKYGSSKRTQQCARRGCKAKLGKFHCQFHKLHSEDFESSSTLSPGYPLFRVECHRGKAHVTWFYTIWPATL